MTDREFLFLSVKKQKLYNVEKESVSYPLARQIQISAKSKVTSVAVGRFTIHKSQSGIIKLRSIRARVNVGSALRQKLGRLDGGHLKTDPPAQ